MAGLLPSLATLQAFEAVARRRSFTLAASELHLTPSAISHQISRLEAQVGVRLLERSPHGAQLSGAGERYLSRIGSALAVIEAATSELRDGVTNSLFLHAAPSIASLWLLPRLPEFRRIHPEIAVNLTASHTVSDFALGECDIDLRYGVPDWKDVEVRTLFEERVLPLASPSFTRSHRLKKLDDLAGVPLIQSSVNVVQWADWFTRFTGTPAPNGFAMRFDRSQMALDAAAQGLGVALESTTLAERHLADGSLMPIFDAELHLPVQAHFAVYPERHKARAPVAAFLRWLARVSAVGEHSAPRLDELSLAELSSLRNSRHEKGG